LRRAPSEACSRLLFHIRTTLLLLSSFLSFLLHPIQQSRPSGLSRRFAQLDNTDISFLVPHLSNLPDFRLFVPLSFCSARFPLVHSCCAQLSQWRLHLLLLAPPAWTRSPRLSPPTTTTVSTSALHWFGSPVVLSLRLLSRISLRYNHHCRAIPASFSPFNSTLVQSGLTRVEDLSGVCFISSPAFNSYGFVLPESSFQRSHSLLLGFHCARSFGTASPKSLRGQCSPSS
jgi:hypothetical protein